MEAVKQVQFQCSVVIRGNMCFCTPQGSATVGLKSKTHVVLVALKVAMCVLCRYLKVYCVVVSTNKFWVIRLDVFL